MDKIKDINLDREIGTVLIVALLILLQDNNVKVAEDKEHDIYNIIKYNKIYHNFSYIFFKITSIFN